jgi:uncharacterized protein YukE
MTVVVPPPVVGDPAGMRALAHALRAAASDFAAIARMTSSVVTGLPFEGPAAKRIRARVHDRTAATEAVARALHDLADFLLRAAAQVEAAQAARERALEARAREIANEAKMKRMPA